MGTYTANYNLYMPTIGEQGWGELINGNYQTIDTTMKSLSNRLTTCESTDVAYNTRITALESGEFETINCAGSIVATELCGKRVGVATTTQPNSWNPEFALSKGFSFIHNTGYGNPQTYSENISLSSCVYWDKVENPAELVTYTIQYNPGWTTAFYMSNIIVNITDVFTGEVTTKTFSGGTSTTTYTMSAPMLANVSVTATLNVLNDDHMSSSVTVSRPSVYIKPKGT